KTNSAPTRRPSPERLTGGANEPAPVSLAVPAPRVAPQRAGTAVRGPTPRPGRRGVRRPRDPAAGRLAGPVRTRPVRRRCGGVVSRLAAAPQPPRGLAAAGRAGHRPGNDSGVGPAPLAPTAPDTTAGTARRPGMPGRLAGHQRRVADRRHRTRPGAPA